MLHRLKPRIQGVRCGFTGRTGGVSLGPLASLNLALRAGESKAALVENWDRATSAVRNTWTSAQVAIVDQVHQNRVLTVCAPSGPLHTLGEADALVTALPAIVLAVRTADCVPVLLESEACIGAAHAGWRGVAAGVLAATVAQMQKLGAETIHAVIGPHIGIDAYEVGEEVVAGICATGVPERVFVRRAERAHVDVGAAAQYQLQALGVQVRRIRLCTTGSGFFSHRADGASTGRQAGLIGRIV